MSASPFSPLSPTASASVVPLPRAASSVTISDSASISDPVVLAQLNDQRRRIDDLQRQLDVKSEAGRAERACHSRELESLRAHSSVCVNRCDARCAVLDDECTALREAAEAAGAQAKLQREKQEALTAEVQRIEEKQQQQQQDFANQLSALRAIIEVQQRQLNGAAMQISENTSNIKAQQQQQRAMQMVIETHQELHRSAANQINALKATIDAQQQQHVILSADAEDLRTSVMTITEAAAAAVTRLTVVPVSRAPVDPIAASLVLPPVLGSGSHSALQTQVGRLVTAVQALQSPQSTLLTQYMGPAHCSFPASAKDQCVRFVLTKEMAQSHFVVSASVSLQSVTGTSDPLKALWSWAGGSAAGGATAAGQPIKLTGAAHAQLVRLVPTDQTARQAEITLRLDRSTFFLAAASGAAGSHPSSSKPSSSKPPMAEFTCVCSVREVPGLPEEAAAEAAAAAASSPSSVKSTIYSTLSLAAPIVSRHETIELKSSSLVK